MNALFLISLTEEYKRKFTATGISCTFKTNDTATDEDYEQADIIFGNPPLEKLKSTNIRWLQLGSAGASTYCTLPNNILLTNASGAYGQAISEHMLACTLATTKKLFSYEKVQSKHDWTNLGSVPTISSLRVLSVGMGNIGSSYAKLMHKLGSTVYGVRRTLHEAPDYIQRMYSFENFDEILPDVDIVALSLPETKETIHLFDYERLHKCKKGAMLINVGRGSAIVTKDLVKVMKEKYLSAACLDVTEYEPLPKNMDLWNIDNVYITPHISGKFNAECNYDNVISIMYNNLLHYLHNEPLENIVNKDLGY